MNLIRKAGDTATKTAWSTKKNCGIIHILKVDQLCKKECVRNEERVRGIGCIAY